MTSKETILLDHCVLSVKHLLVVQLNLIVQTRHDLAVSFVQNFCCACDSAIQNDYTIKPS